MMQGTINLQLKQALVSSPKPTAQEGRGDAGLSAFSVGKDEQVNRHFPNVIGYHQHFEDVTAKEYYDKQLVGRPPHQSPSQADATRSGPHSELTNFMSRSEILNLRYQSNPTAFIPTELKKTSTASKQSSVARKAAGRSHVMSMQTSATKASTNGSRLRQSCKRL